MNGTHLLYESFQDGIRGIRTVESGVPGPTFGITACTHGGEVVGMDIADRLLGEFGIGERLRKGRLVFVLVNLPAYLRWKETGDVVGSRYLEENLNRACTDENVRTSASAEIARVRELLPTLRTFDYCLDIHSTYKPSESMGIVSRRGAGFFGDVMNVALELPGLLDVVSGGPLIGLVERAGGVAAAIESGCQFDPAAHSLGLDVVVRALRKLGMLAEDDGSSRYLLPPAKKVSIPVVGSVMVRNSSFRPAREFLHGDAVRAGEPIAFDGESEIVADRDAVVLMPSPKSLYESMPGEEYCFLGEPRSS